MIQNYVCGMAYIHTYMYMYMDTFTFSMWCTLYNVFFIKIVLSSHKAPEVFKHYSMHTAMRFELATRRVTSPDSEIFTPFELQVNFAQKMLALPYQKYTFSERKFDEEFKYGFEIEVGWGTNILWLKLFRFCGPQNQIFLRAISLFPIIRFISPQHIWIPHQISFQKMYNYRILLIFIM